MATDPVCGMYVDEATADLRLLRDNRTYFFCSSHCLQEFSQPERAIGRLRTMLAVSWPAAVAVLLLTYAQPFPAWPWAALLLATLVQFYPGRQFYVSTLDAIKGRNWNMDVLIAVGTTAAYGYSLLVLLLPARLPPAFFFDASAVIVTLILTGNYLEHLTRERARGTLRRLQELLPSSAMLVRDGVEVELPVSEVQLGDHLKVRPGARFPTDGRVLEGSSTVNEAALTGESMPIEKHPGSLVLAGCVNGLGLLLVEATKVGEDTALAQIGQLVAEAETSRVPLQRLADRIASSFVPLVLILAISASLLWSAYGVGLSNALLVFVSVVIIACPCAFGIATPAALVVGTGRAAEEGVLFKGRDSLERASRVDLVLTDKTGTLTRGVPALSDVIPGPGVQEPELIALAAAVGAGSDHPLSRAVLVAADARGLIRPPAEGMRADPGLGVRARIGGQEVAVLNGAGARASGAELAPFRGPIDRLAAQGRAWSVVLRGSEPLGILGFEDEVDPGVPSAIRTLREDGIAVVMVTGDHEAAARTVAREVGIDEVHAGMSPGAKLDLIREFQRTGRKVAYVGDGINDAPALAAADLGIAIGAGTEVAREASGVVLTRAGFGGVAMALRIGRRTVRKVRGNLAWAIGYNMVLLPVAMGALVPLFGLGVFQVLPIAGAVAMALSSTTVVLNSLSLRTIRLEPASRRLPGAPVAG